MHLLLCTVSSKLSTEVEQLVGRTFKRRIAILQEIVELARVSLNEIPYTGVEDGRDGDKQLLVFSQILEARHYHCSAEKIVYISR